MKILAVADRPAPILYDHFNPDRFSDIDLVLSCGDLRANYLSFLVTMLNVPVYYVRGNHDYRYETEPPGGCEDIDMRIVNFQGLRILGLEGARKYTNRAVQYTEWGMYWRVLKMVPRIWVKKGIDIVIAHAPPLDIHDAEDRCHRGFSSFRWLIDKFQPKFFLHGHVHLNYTPSRKRVTKVGNTYVINVDGYYVFDYDAEPSDKVAW